MNPLVEVYSTMSNKELAEYFGVSETTIRAKAKKLGLKPKDVLKAFAKERGGHDWCEVLVDIGRKCPKAYSCNNLEVHKYLLEIDAHPCADLQERYKSAPFIFGFLKSTDFDPYVLERLDDLPDTILPVKSVNTNRIRRCKLYPYWDKIISLRRDGKSCREIADSLPIYVNYTTVSRFLKKIG